jgi:SAM-dependent methyltransferase
MTFDDAKQRFSNRVADYVRYRPSYPVALLELLRAECALRPEHVLADVGSGTGLLSKLFLENGNRVLGVEPNAEMREAGEEYLRAFENFSSVIGSAEMSTLGNASVDFVTAGQAFHWFEPKAARREFVRILKPSGWFVVVWHDRRMEETQFGRDYEALLVRYGTDYTRVKDAYPEFEQIRNFFGESTFVERDLPNEQLLDWDGLSGRLRSSSYAPLEGHPKFASMMADLQEIFRVSAENGVVRMQYFTRIYFGQLQASGTHA